MHLSHDNASPLNYLEQVFPGPFPKTYFKPTTAKEIPEIVNALKSSNSYGYDEIPVKVIKCSLPFIISPLTHICNKSLSMGTFPS
jgi:hypothetical protein